MATFFWYDPLPAAWANQVAVSENTSRLPKRKNVRARGVPQHVPEAGPLPALAPGGGVPRGARLAGADGQRRALAEPAADSGPLCGAQPEGLMGEDEDDRSPTPSSGGTPSRSGTWTIVCREEAAKENRPASRLLSRKRP